MDDDAVSADATPVYRLMGINASPYSVKMRALMRYRRLPFVWHRSAPQFCGGEIAAPLPLIPVLRLPEDGSLHVDSHRLVELLEQRHGSRSVVPRSPGLQFLARLIEDFADEWLSKPMFFYRWASAEGIRFARAWVGAEIFGAGRPVGLVVGSAELDGFAERQIARMDALGSGLANAKVLEDDYRRLLDVMARLLPERRFLFGDRPSAADFAMYGQLRELTTDPVSAALAHRIAPTLPIWLDVLDDASGEEGGDWIGDADVVGSPGLMALLDLIGQSYAIVMAENLRSVATGGADVVATLDGVPFKQAASRYNAKRWRRLGDDWRAAEHDMPASLRTALADRGCRGANA